MGRVVGGMRIGMALLVAVALATLPVAGSTEPRPDPLPEGTVEFAEPPIIGKQVEVKFTLKYAEGPRFFRLQLFVPPSVNVEEAKNFSTTIGPDLQSFSFKLTPTQAGFWTLWLGKARASAYSDNSTGRVFSSIDRLADPCDLSVEAIAFLTDPAAADRENASLVTIRYFVNSTAPWLTWARVESVMWGVGYGALEIPAVRANTTNRVLETRVRLVDSEAIVQVSTEIIVPVHWALGDTDQNVGGVPYSYIFHRDDSQSSLRLKERQLMITNPVPENECTATIHHRASEDVRFDEPPTTLAKVNVTSTTPPPAEKVESQPPARPVPFAPWLALGIAVGIAILRRPVSR